MKKTRFLALTLVVALALMGAGYAAWMDVLKVDTTVKTGYLDVDFTGVKSETSSEWVEVTHNYITALNDGNETGPTADLDKVVLKIRNLYPGAWVEETVTFENKGTMPVKVSDLMLTAAGGDEATLARMIVVHEGEELVFENGATTMWLPIFGGHNHWDFWNKKADCPKCTPLTSPEDPPVEPAVLILEPGESADYTVKFVLDIEAEDNITELQEVTFELSINFTQYNID